MTADSRNLLQSLPSVDKLLNSDMLTATVQSYGHNSVKLEVRRQLDQLRSGLAAADLRDIERVTAQGFVAQLCTTIKNAVQIQYASTLKPVFNLTGTVIHTNLGRAALPAEAIQAMTMAAREATNLEFDLTTGKRGDRDRHLEQALCDITGAEAATVVNNNAAAVLLMLNTLAPGKEVLISRGELVEIGGAFRIPEVMASAQCLLKEIGTTNRTHLKDYKSAINANTAVLMKVHTSNYEIKGFTQTVAEADIADIAHHHELPFIVDLGSGTLVELQQFGLPAEPTVSNVLASGADLVSFSGDKLLGGPQAGIIVGNKELVERIKSNPMKRALRVDKITMAALLEVIYLYRDPQRLSQRLPILVDLSRSSEEIAHIAKQVLPTMERLFDKKAKVTIEPCKSQIGSGALPLDLLDSQAIVIKPNAIKGQSDAALNQIAAAFRALPKPILGRLHDGRLLLDLRCLRDVKSFLAQLAGIDFFPTDT